MRKPGNERMRKLWQAEPSSRTQAGQSRVVTWAWLYIRHCRRQRWSGDPGRQYVLINQALGLVAASWRRQ